MQAVAWFVGTPDGRLVAGEDDPQSGVEGLRALAVAYRPPQLTHSRAANTRLACMQSRRLSQTVQTPSPVSISSLSLLLGFRVKGLGFSRTNAAVSDSMDRASVVLESFSKTEWLAAGSPAGAARGPGGPRVSSPLSLCSASRPGGPRQLGVYVKISSRSRSTAAAAAARSNRSLSGRGRLLLNPTTTSGPPGLRPAGGPRCQAAVPRSFQAPLSVHFLRSFGVNFYINK